MEVEFYTELDEISIYNWRKISETSELRWLVKSGELLSTNYEQAILIYNKLQQDYITLFGTNNDTDYLMILIKRKIVLTADLIITGERALKNQINILQAEIDFLTSQFEKNGSISLDEQLISMGKFLGYGLKSKETTVTEFKATINLIEQWQKSKSKEQM